MNAWLDTLSTASRSFHGGFAGLEKRGWMFATPDDAPFPSPAHIYRSMFYWSDMVHSHAPLRAFAPPGTFCFTMLRAPLTRLISQITDWRRLTPADVAHYHPDVQDCVLDSGKLPLSEHLARHGQGTGRMLLDNFMTRALAAGRLGSAVRDAATARDLLPEALRALHEDFDLVGLAEEFDLSRQAFCALLGLPPAGSTPPLNQSRPRATADDASLYLPPETIEAYTGCDQLLYAAAQGIFSARHRGLAAGYTAACFEQAHAAQLLSALRGTFYQGTTRHSVSDPFYGSGLHGRDGARTGHHAVWSGPQCGMTLYIPVPPFMAVAALLWIGGYADIAQRASLRVSIDGRERPHRFESTADAADLLTVDCFSTGPFIRLELTVGQVFASDDLPPPQPRDTRRRGVSFCAYGWRPLADYPPDL